MSDTLQYILLLLLTYHVLIFVILCAILVLDLLDGHYRSLNPVSVIFVILGFMIWEITLPLISKKAKKELKRGVAKCPKKYIGLKKTD